VDLITLVITLLVIFVLGCAAYWIITKFFKDPQVQTIALVIVGVILLIVLLVAVFPGAGNYRVWK
jgi:DMSO reductase anchor subunit